MTAIRWRPGRGGEQRRVIDAAVGLPRVASWRWRHSLSHSGPSGSSPDEWPEGRSARPRLRRWRQSSTPRSGARPNTWLWDARSDPATSTVRSRDSKPFVLACSESDATRSPRRTATNERGRQLSRHRLGLPDTAGPKLQYAPVGDSLALRHARVSARRRLRRRARPHHPHAAPGSRQRGATVPRVAGA